MKKLKVEILKNEKKGPNYFLMELRCGYIASHSKPGQFVHVRIKAEEGRPFLRRPFSIHSVENKDTFHLLYEAVGRGTEILSEYKKGRTLDVIGPLGNGFKIEPQKVNLLVAGGMGFAPLLFLAQVLKRNNSNKEIIAFAGAKSKDRLRAQRELTPLGIGTYVCTDDGTCGEKKFVTELLEKFMEKNPAVREEILISACGPNAMLKAVIEIAGKFKVRSQVSMEEVFACGVGACLGCAVKTRGGYELACKKGPVFDGNEIIL